MDRKFCINFNGSIIIEAKDEEKAKDKIMYSEVLADADCIIIKDVTELKDHKEEKK